MRLWLGVVAVLLTLSGLAPARASARDCTGQTCGAPVCSDFSRTQVRPGRTRTLTVYCERVTRARLLTGPADGTITDVAPADYGAFRFTVRMDGDAAGEQHAKFELTGHNDNTIVQDVALPVVPLSVNTPPMCWSQDAQLRSDGVTPPGVWIPASCYDDEGDGLTVDGTGPGTHVDAPVTVPAGSGMGGWWYRPSIAVGTERTAIFATDELGARSEDAGFAVTVGPDVDAPASCGSASPDDPVTIFTRPGAIRRFTVNCYDPDGDPVTAAVGDAPAHGALALVGDTGSYFDATYTPYAGGVPRETFTMRAAVAGRADTTTRFAITQRELPDNGYGGCGWGSAWASSTVPGVLELARCDDEEGDPLSAEVVTPPAHGTVGPIAVVPGSGGAQLLTAPFVPEPGFEGVDCVTIVVRDGHGFETRLTIDIDTRPGPAPPVWTPPEPYPEPVWPLPLPLPGHRTPPPSTKDLARVALGTPRVRRVAILPGVEAWAPATLSRARLQRERRVPGLLLLCSAGCDLRTTTAWTPRRRGARASAEHGAAQVAAGKPRVVWADAGRAARTAKRLALRVRVSAGERRRTVRRTLRVGR